MERPFMKNITILFLLLCAFVSTSQAQTSTPQPLRQVKFTAIIEKVVFQFDENGMPSWVSTPVCTQESFMNVYKESDNSWSSLMPGDLHLIHCEGEIEGQKVSVSEGGAVRLYPMAFASGSVEMKGVALFLGWGDFDAETTKLVHSTSSDPWMRFQDILAPVSTGKIVDGVPQTPEPKEYFTAVINIVDESH
jgi:hypothetical protein